MVHRALAVGISFCLSFLPAAEAFAGAGTAVRKPPSTTRPQGSSLQTPNLAETLSLVRSGIGWSEIYTQPANLAQVPFVAELNLAQVNGQSLGALARVMDNAGVDAKVVDLDASPAEQARAVARHLGFYASSVIVDRSGAMSYLLGPAAATREDSLEKIEIDHAKLKDLAAIVSIFPRTLGETILQDEREKRREVRGRIEERSKEKISAARARWEKWVPETAEEWEQFEAALADDESRPLTFQEMASEVLENTDQLLLAARASPNRTRFDSTNRDDELLRENQQRKWMLNTRYAGNPEQLSAEHMAPQQRRLLEDLRRGYVPTLNPARTVTGDSGLADMQDTGVANNGWTSIDRESVVVLSAREDSFWWMGAAIHEGLHQGDAGSFRGLNALRRLFQRSGYELGVILIEGWTQRRTIDRSLRMLEDGYNAANPAAVEFRRRVERELGTRTLEDSREALSNRFREHGYWPYVELADDIIAREGGSQALEAFAMRGSVRELVELIGAENVGMMARLVGIQGNISDKNSKTRGVLLGQAGFSSWILEKIRLASRGMIGGAAEVSQIRKAARSFVDEAETALRPYTPGARFELASAFEGYDFNAALQGADAGVMVGDLLNGRRRKQAVVRAATGGVGALLWTGSALILGAIGLNPFAVAGLIGVGATVALTLSVIWPSLHRRLTVPRLERLLRFLLLPEDRRAANG